MLDKIYKLTQRLSLLLLQLNLIQFRSQSSESQLILGYEAEAPT